MKLLSSRFWGKMRRFFVILSGSTRNIGRIVLVVLVRSFCVDVAISWLTFLFNGKWKMSDRLNGGHVHDKPKWLSTWLMIDADNVWHFLINTLTIMAYYQWS